MKKYRIRLRNGRVVGPFLAEQFKELLAKKHIDGSEDCQEYPVGDWDKINNFPEIEVELNKTKITESEATFIRKINQFKKEEPEKVNHSTDEKQEFVEFKFDKVEPIIEIPIEEEDNSENEDEETSQGLEKTIIVAKKNLSSTLSEEDKTVIKPETIEYLKTQKEIALYSVLLQWQLSYFSPGYSVGISRFYLHSSHY